MRGVKSYQRIPGRKRDRTCPDCASILVKGQERYKNKKIIPFPRCEPSDLSQHLEEQCRIEGIMTDSFLFTGDYYALPNLLPANHQTFEIGAFRGNHRLAVAAEAASIGEIKQWTLINYTRF